MAVALGAATMKCEDVCEQIRQIGILPAVRVSTAEEAHFAAEAVSAGGIPIVEITMTVPEAVELIAHLVKQHKKILVGAGTVLDTETARRCLDAGAAFLTAPGFDDDLLDFAKKEDVAVLPGALTPTEVIRAWRAGANFVKVFPCGQVGGEKYIKALKTALPQISLIAAGGVTQQNAGAFILAGASAIGVGTELIPPDAVQHREIQRIKELARRFVTYVKDARRRLGPDLGTASETKTDFLKLHKQIPRPTL
jgi:2-dehydro-3-deoxyphosphogluconate aldolase / (4S)-4-hydroxy-2-oxoglutarate aldolase